MEREAGCQPAIQPITNRRYVAAVSFLPRWQGALFRARPTFPDSTVWMQIAQENADIMADAAPGDEYKANIAV